MPRKFIVVGHPRSGSTFLIERLALATGADIPPVNHAELFNVYEKLFNTRVLQLDGSSEQALLESYFAGCTQQFAGIKTIPSFHREWAALAALPDVQFITITRTDVLGTIASMLISERLDNWQTPVRQQLGGAKFRFREFFPDARSQEMYLGDLLNRLLFDLRTLERLNAHPNTIAIRCEDMLGSFQSPRLDAYFGQPVLLRGFAAPTSPRECFEDVDEFRRTIVDFLRSTLQYDSAVPPLIHDLIISS